MLSRVVATTARRVAADWPAVGAVALAVVLGHSALVHLAGDEALARHYAEAVGAPGFAWVSGVLQLVAAVALAVRRTRRVACAAIAGVILAGVVHRIAAGHDGDGVPAALALAVAAIAIGFGTRVRRG
jgi:hypothetical protein